MNILNGFLGLLCLILGFALLLTLWTPVDTIAGTLPAGVALFVRLGLVMVSLFLGIIIPFYMMLADDRGDV